MNEAAFALRSSITQLQRHLERSCLMQPHNTINRMFRFYNAMGYRPTATKGIGPSSIRQVQHFQGQQALPKSPCHLPSSGHLASSSYRASSVLFFFFKCHVHYLPVYANSPRVTWVSFSSLILFSPLPSTQYFERSRYEAIRGYVGVTLNFIFTF